MSFVLQLPRQAVLILLLVFFGALCTSSLIPAMGYFIVEGLKQEPWQIGLYTGLVAPLTMVVKIMLENTQDLRWVAVLLDKEVPAWAMPPEVAGSDLEMAGTDGRSSPLAREAPDAQP